MLALLTAAALPTAARPALVCRVTARVPSSAARSPGSDSTRVFLQTADLLEERRSGSPSVDRWLVTVDTPNQLIAVDAARTLTLIIDRPGGEFAESGVLVQRRGYCRLADLP